MLALLDIPGPLADASRWWLFAGKLHPVVVHFPIALLMVAAALEFLRLRRGEHRPGRAAIVCLGIGAPSAVLAAALGWSDAVTSGHQGSDAWVLDWHRWLGIAAAGIAVLAALAALAARSIAGRRTFAWYRLTLVLSAVLVAVTGHFGGSLIYGTQYFPESWAKATGAPTGAGPTLVASASTTIDFARDIQPILARRCYQCHAGDKVESELHLDSLQGALKGGKSGHPAIIPGRPGASELVRLIKGLDPKRSMPPKGGALEPLQIAALEAWIAQGAKWSDTAGEHWHWSYRPPVRPNLPQIQDTYWPRTPIDHFILAKLESLGLKPSAEADKEILIRRVALDLTGLPPTPAEIAAFVTDPAADAYDELVERLLASPAYGERMAMKWLDLARYADTHGYEKDERRTMWPYRDWVIDAFNRDLPFDQFTIQQLAGDLLPDPTTDQLLATGFNRNTQINEEGGVDAEEFRVDAVIDRVNTMGTVWLGSTVGCAQCHNHKNDPITQEEYYRLFAYFNQDDSDTTPISTGSLAAGGMLPISTPEHRDEFAALLREIPALETQLADYPESELAAAQAAWERDQSTRQTAWTILNPTSVLSAAGATMTRQADGSWLASEMSKDKDTYTIETPVELAAATALRLEVLPDPSTPGMGVGRSAHGNIVLQDLRISAAIAPGADFAPIVVPQAAADFEQGAATPGEPTFPASAAVDADPRSGWALAPDYKAPHTAVFRFERPLGGGAGSSGSGFILRIVMAQNYGGYHTIGRFRLSITNDPDPLAAAPLSPEIAAILTVPADARTPDQSAKLAAYYRSIAPALRETRDRLLAARQRQAALTIAKAMVMKRADARRETRIFERGSFLSPGEPVEPGIPAAIARNSRDTPRDRLELARWLVSEKNPLSARVTVNRLWEQHFGRGLVETSEDFGTQGDLPSNPDLLDWLATELPRRGWSLKSMHRLIVQSAAYRQSSAVPKDLLDRDPRNDLLARAPRLRVEAETVRDIALAASGLLSRKIGGPSVFPPQPDGVWTMIYNADKWMVSQGEDRYRRGLYTFSRRTAPYPAFTNFDATSREVMCTRRARTNTPLQALTTLNDPQFVEAAVALGSRMLREGGPTDRERIAYGFQLCTARHPTDAEAARVLELVTQEREAFAQDPSAATALISQVPEPVRSVLDPAELAAWTIAGNVLLNLDETVTRQ